MRLLKKILWAFVAAFWLVPAALIAFYALLAGTPVGDYLANKQREGCVSFEELHQADLLVVLGGDIGQRSLSALRVWRAGLADRFVVTGQDVLVEYLQAGGVPATAIAVDSFAKRTIDHPETIKKAVPGIDENTRLIVLSSGLQERRAKYLFERAGYKDVQVYSWERDYKLYMQSHSEEFASSRWDAFQANQICYAYLAWLKYFIVD
ncbi:MAG: YdcF family protein [Opitutales bacterium]|nr:YdcF family protein [Opitutales bacterium]